MNAEEILKAIDNLTEKELGLILQKTDEIKINNKREEIYKADDQIDNILIRLKEKYGLTDEYGNEIDSINFKYDEDDDSVIVTFQYY